MRLEIIRLTAQPAFPSEDILPDNGAILEKLLTQEGALSGQAELFARHQRSLHYMAMRALREYGSGGEDSRETYFAFCYGFGAMELAMAILRQKPFDTSLAAKQLRKLFPAYPIDEGSLVADIPTTGVLELNSAAREISPAERVAAWPAQKPNTFGLLSVLLEEVPGGGTAAQAGLVGAQIAGELQDPLVSAA